MATSAEPREPRTTELPEITVKAVVLGLVLSVLLAAANAYLGLFAGLTVSASIPAAVVSMAVLRLFRRTNILENNIVQTAASAGEALAAGVIFTIPALVIMGEWTSFRYWEITVIAALGGVIGVLFTIPLRRAYIVENPLRYPEGVATAEVLQVGERGGAGVRYLAGAAVVGALFKLGQTGLRFWSGALEAARFAGGTVLYFGTNLSPALVAVGYIVGLNIAVLLFLGGAFNWWVAVPIATALFGVPAGAETAADAGWTIWSTQTRYIGVGAMILGGVWTLVRVRRSLVSGIRSGLEAYRAARDGRAPADRADRDMPMPWVGAGIAASAVPLYVVFHAVTDSAGVALFMAVAMLIAGFLFSAVAGYMAGLVGSSNNPISGVTIATILTSALLLALLLGTDSPVGPAAAVLIGAVVACAAGIAGDNMQDLMTGRIVGATPYRQQIMQILGVMISAFVMAPVLTLLLNAYGIGSPTDAHPNPLPAPQATLMAAVASGVFQGGLPWGMVAVGILVAAAVIALDVVLEMRGSSFRTPVLAVAIGIYLPLELSVAILLGGLVSWAAARRLTRPAKVASGPDTARIGSEATKSRTGLPDPEAPGPRHGLLFAAGLITGEALVGIGLAVPIVLAGRADVLAIIGTHDAPWPGVVLLALIMYGLFRVGSAREAA